MTRRAKAKYWSAIAREFEIPDSSTEYLKNGVEFLGRELLQLKDKKGEDFVRVSM